MLLAVSGCAAVVIACSSDDATARLSNRGEACRVTGDCAGGLACAPLSQGGGVCVTGQFHVEPTAKQCVVEQCTVTSDCCNPSLEGSCAALQQSCLADAGAVSEQACQQYRAQCGCDNGTLLCDNGTCVSRCELDQDCSGIGSAPRCSGGKCVQCTADTDCPDNGLCNGGTCQPLCGADGDCAGFDRCVSGRCIASGCQTDRECIAATLNVDAKCKTDGKCIVPCESDLECGNPTGYNFFSCIEKECTYVGCVSDKDCRLLIAGDASLSANVHVSCRDPGIGVVTP